MRDQQHQLSNGKIYGRAERNAAVTRAAAASAVFRALLSHATCSALVNTEFIF